MKKLLIISLIIMTGIIITGQTKKDSSKGFVMDKVVKSSEEWQTCLTPEEYQVLREKGTEAAFTGKYYKYKEVGTYLCAACGNELFAS